MPTITRIITGDVDDLDSVTLLTLVRTDNGADVAFPGGGVFTEGASNDWSITFTAPAGSLTYAYTYRRAFADGSHLDGAGTLVDAVGQYVGRYCSTSDIDQFQNQLNVTVRSDLDDDNVRDPGAIQQAIETGEARVDFYTYGPWTFSGDANGTIARQTFRQWAYKMASYELENKRGFTTSDAKENPYLAARDEAIEEMKAFLQAVSSGFNPLPGATGPTDASGILAAQDGLAPQAGCVPCAPCGWPARLERYCWN